MTDRSNPITDILKRLLADVDDNMEFIGTTWNSKEHASSSVSRSLDEALQALYEAVAKAIWELPEYGDKVSLVSKREALVTLRALFGVEE